VTFAVLFPVSAAAASVTASKSCLTSPCTVVEAKFTLNSAQTIQWQAAYTGSPTQGHSFYLSTVASNLADIALTTSGQTGGTKLLPAGTYYISIRLALMGPGTYTVFYNSSLSAAAGAASGDALPGSVRVSEEQAARLALRLGAAGDARAEGTARDVLRALGPTLGASSRDELRLFSAGDDALGQKVSLGGKQPSERSGVSGEPCGSQRCAATHRVDAQAITMLPAPSSATSKKRGLQPSMTGNSGPAGFNKGSDAWATSVGESNTAHGSTIDASVRFTVHLHWRRPTRVPARTVRGNTTWLAGLCRNATGLRARLENPQRTPRRDASSPCCAC
jgi:hypothetical protein